MNFFSRNTERTIERLEVTTEIGTVTVAVRRHARARNYSLRITGPGLPPVLTLPQRGSVRAAREFLERHAEWLGRQMKKAPRTQPIADGTAIPLRGVQHRIRHVAGRRGTVTPMNGEDGPELLVFGEKAHLKRRVIDFLKREARADLGPAVERHAKRLAVRPTTIRIRDTKSRWGSCSHTGHLSFSYRLVMAPPAVLDYLAAHEVAHLVEMNHSKRYWTVVKSICPEFQAARGWLLAHGASLHAIGAADG